MIPSHPALSSYPFLSSRKPRSGYPGSIAPQAGAYPPPFRRCYTGAMTTPPAHLPPILRAALAKKIRGRALTPGREGGAPAGENNFVAETPKNPAGARPGNRNALKHGRYTREKRARMAEVRARIRQFTRRVNAALARVEKPHV